MKMQVKDAFDQTSDQTEAEIFLSHLLGEDRSFLKAFPETELTNSQIEQFNDFSVRRKKHEPLAYILGFQHFYGLEFKVTKEVLIPRPETENLIEEVINHAKTLTRPDPVIVDVGTGSGVIAVTLAKHLPNSRLIALDIDEAALKVAGENVAKHKVANQIQLIRSDLLTSLTTKADIIVANLPYIPTARLDTLAPELSWEPKVALDGGSDGMRLYRKLFAQAKQKLKADGVLFCEIDNGEVLRKDLSSLQADDPLEQLEAYK